jgi:hypothetical protein
VNLLSNDPRSATMSRWYEGANEASFKAVNGGYVFQNPNPWMFARPSYYLVNDAKKAEILVHLGRWRLMIFLVSVTPLLFALTAIVSSPTLGSFLLPVSRALGPVLFTLVVCAAATILMSLVMAIPQIYLARSLRPLLADAPRTAERIKIAEQLPTIAASVSSTVLVAGLIGGLGMMGGGGAMLVDAYYEGHLARGLAASLLLMLLGMLLTAYLVYLLRLKTKMARA